jgi:YesN/AraC family two-component response regulator
MLVDDQPLILEGIKTLLSIDDNIAVVAMAKSSEEALELLERLAPAKVDLILMDIRMPGMDGYQAIEIIRDINPTANIAAVTAYGGASDREACLKAGCVDYLAKPFHSKDLFAMLRRVIQWPPEEK